MNADDKIVVFTAADVDALHEPVRALLARLDAISAASDAVVDAGPADMFSAEASEAKFHKAHLDCSNAMTWDQRFDRLMRHASTQDVAWAMQHDRRFVKLVETGVSEKP